MIHASLNNFLLDYWVFFFLVINTYTKFSVNQIFTIKSIKFKHFINEVIIEC